MRKVSEEAASTTGLTEALAAIVPALEAFQGSGEAPDPTLGSRVSWWNALDEPLPMSGIGDRQVLQRLREIIPCGVRIGAPGFSSNITTAPTLVPAVAAFAASIAFAQREWNHAGNLIEALALKWLIEMLGLSPDEYQGVFTDGGSSANLVCLIAARQSAYERAGIDPALRGVAGIPRPTFYTSDQVTGVLHRQLAMMGLGREALRTVPCDRDFRLDVAALRECLDADEALGCTPIGVIATAGTTSTGSIDPIADLATLCRERGLWLHVDGAYGLPGILDGRVASQYEGLASADSFVMDPHKWFGVPVGCGAAFVRDREILKRSFALGPAPFLALEEPEGCGPDDGITSVFDTWGIHFGDRGPSSSAPTRGAAVWSLFKEIGVEGLRARICRHNSYARALARLVERSESLQLMAPVTLSICCFRCVPAYLRGREEEMRGQLDALNRTVLKRMRARGRYTPSATTINDAFVLRPCFINPRMQQKEVAGLVQEAEACGAEVWAETLARSGVTL